jgi:hypothetical protein
MKINIRDRCQKISQFFQETKNYSQRAIAKILGISKSSVQRHLSTRSRLNQRPESHFWETVEGEKWLRLLVFGVIYCFGIKGGVGAESISTFFHLLHLEEHIGCSPSTIRVLESQLKAKIIEYEQAQSLANQQEQPIAICIGADETFFGLPILVAIELASGFIFSEVECKNRTYETWWEQISTWFNKEQWQCRFMVSDGAKALVKLSLSGLKCPNIPDLFHLLREFSKSMGSAIALQQARLQKEQVALATQSSPASKALLVELQKQQSQVETDHKDYQESLHTISQSIHPFDINTGEAQIKMDLEDSLRPSVAVLERLSQSYAPTKSQAAVERWKKQIPILSGVIDAWWQWALEALSAETPEIALQNWVLNRLLPWVYWHQQTEKTRQTQLKQGYEQATKLAHNQLLRDDMTRSLSGSERQYWINWAISMCSKFQRTSSAVEGRNGYLSRLHHANRGLTEQTLQVLTIIHNFDIKRDDDSTAAQRLFGHPFPDLFESVVTQMRDLPRPRRTLKTPKSRKPTLYSVPL